MDAFTGLGSLIVFALVVVLVPLSILRALDEIKASQRRLERRLEEIDARLTHYGASSPDRPVQRHQRVSAQEGRRGAE